MRALFVAPLAPPVTGQSVASEAFLDALRDRHDAVVVNLSVGSTNDGSFTGRRVIEVLRVLGAVWRARHADVAYLTISESLAGNLKDVLIYLIWARRLKRVVIHLHGGSIKRLLFDPRPWVSDLNKRFVRRLGAVVISGESHRVIFADMIDQHRVHVVPNFAPERLFLPSEAVERKFSNLAPIRLIYISGMATAKGYRALADGFMGLSADERRRFRLDFAGRFDSADEEQAFRAHVATVPEIEYHGLVDENTKARLFADAHVFCLPTAMFEGQPISILEAYASGCVVMTTGQAGIRDVFRDERNGLELSDASAEAVRATLRRLLDESGRLCEYARRNAAEASRSFRVGTYSAALMNILERSSGDDRRASA